MIGAVVGVLWVIGVGLVLTRRRESPASRFARVVVALATGGVDRGRRSPLAIRCPPRSAFVVVPIAFIAGLVVFQARYRGAPVVDRTRLQWVAWGVVVFAAPRARLGSIDSLLGWPEHIADVAVGLSLVVPLALRCSARSRPFAGRVDRLLVRTIEAGGILVLIGVVYVARGARLRRAPDRRRAPGARAVDDRGRDRGAGLRARAQPARGVREPARLRRATRARRSPADVRCPHVARHPARRAAPAARGVAETSMRLTAAEVWTGTDGVLERAAAVPDRGPRRDPARPGEIGGRRARARVGQRVDAGVAARRSSTEHENRVCGSRRWRTRASCSACSCARASEGDAAFTEEEERVLTELARQVGLALHNSAARHRAAGVARRSPHRERRAARARAPASSPPPTSRAARSNATCTTARSSTWSRSR